MRRLLALALAALVLTAVPALAWAAPSSAQVVIVFHAQAHDTKSDLCGTAATYAQETDCAEYTVKWPLAQGADVYLVAVDFIGLDGISGLSCGIDYDNAAGSGADVFDWSLCADLEFQDAGPNGAWPAAGSGNRIYWDESVNCQTSPNPAFFETHGVAGVFYVYAYGEDHFRATINNVSPFAPELYVRDCEQTEWDLPYFQAGEVVFTDNPVAFAFHPCPIPDPVATRSWGALKALY